MSNTKQYGAAGHTTYNVAGGTNTTAEAQRKYPEEHSLVEIVFMDDTTESFMINAGINITAYLNQTLHDTGALVLRNERESMVIPRERLKAFKLTKVTS